MMRGGTFAFCDLPLSELPLSAISEFTLEFEISTLEFEARFLR